MAKFHALEQKILQQLRSLGVQNKSILVAFSGGADSTALAYSLTKLRPILQLDVALAHVHHGSIRTNKYRDEAWRHAMAVADKLSIPFFTNCTGLPFKPSQQLKTEEEMRNFRYQFIYFVAGKNPFDFIALGHQSEDLLETRLIRLIRGTGPEGLESMKVIDGNLLRPFLNISRKEINQYLKDCKIKWLEDPSNQTLDPMRNWLRHNWLRSLEKYRPGSVAAMSRSLGLIVDLIKDQSEWMDDCWTTEGMDRVKMLSLSMEQNRQLIASYLKKIGARRYSKNHIDEILKHLLSPRKKIEFWVAGYHWLADAQQVKVSEKK